MAAESPEIEGSIDHELNQREYEAKPPATTAQIVEVDACDPATDIDGETSKDPTIMNELAAKSNAEGNAVT